jgi:hypothetical protein
MKATVSAGEGIVVLVSRPGLLLDDIGSIGFDTFLRQRLLRLEYRVGKRNTELGKLHVPIRIATALAIVCTQRQSSEIHLSCRHDPGLGNAGSDCWAVSRYRWGRICVSTSTPFEFWVASVRGYFMTLPLMKTVLEHEASEWMKIECQVSCGLYETKLTLAGLIFNSRAHDNPRKTVKSNERHLHSLGEQL